METAIASEQFPGCLVVTEQAGSEELPQTLVVWSPLATAAIRHGPAAMSVRSSSSRPIRRTRLAAGDPLAERRIHGPSHHEYERLADADRSAEDKRNHRQDCPDRSPANGACEWHLEQFPFGVPAAGRGAFSPVNGPFGEEWAEYRASTRTWANVSWPLDSYRATSGTRTVACQTELQLVAGSMASATNTAIPFFGSTSLSYELPR